MTATKSKEVKVGSNLAESHHLHKFLHKISYIKSFNFLHKILYIKFFLRLLCNTSYYSTTHAHCIRYMFRPHGPSSGVFVVVAKNCYFAVLFLVKMHSKRFSSSWLYTPSCLFPLLFRLARFSYLMQPFVFCHYVARRLAPLPTVCRCYDSSRIF
jgi:hypothetical protein